MTIINIWSKEKTKTWLALQPDIIEAYKFVEVKKDRFTNPYVGCINPTKRIPPLYNYLDGLNISPTGPGFYFYIYKRDATRPAKTYSNGGVPHTAIKCLVPKLEIKKIGEAQWGKTFIAEIAVFPHFPETEARYEDLPQTEQEATAMFARMSGDAK